MKSSKPKQEVFQDDSHTSTQLPLSVQPIKCVRPMNFPQKLYQFHALRIAEEYEQALEANSLEKIKNLIDKVLK